MAGTPYWRERKLVTSSSVRKLSFTNALPRRQLVSFCTLVACCNCSGVMIFSLTRRSPSLWDISRAPVRNYKTVVFGRRRPTAELGASFPKDEDRSAAISGDTNCHLDWV